MKQCKWCLKKGFFLTLDEYDLCPDCSTPVFQAVSRAAQIIEESREIINKSKKIDTILSRYQVIFQMLERLKPYDDKNINILSLRPNELREIYLENHDKSIIEYFELHLNQAINKSEIAQTITSKLNPLLKIQSSIQDYKSQCIDPLSLLPLENKIKFLVVKIKFNHNVEAAKKAEFKGQIKKAIEQYQEALYVLKTDYIDDGKQQAHMQSLELKISELQNNRR